MSRSGIMLAYPFEEKRLSKWTAPYIIQPKLDGDRCRAIIDSDGEAILLSSEMNIINSVPHINSALKNLHLRSVELDGELYIHGAPHEVIHGIVSRTENMHPDSALIQFHIFDIVIEGSQIERSTILYRDLIPTKRTGTGIGSPIQVVPIRIIDDIDSIMSTLDDYMNNRYEGFVIRNASGLYARKRSTDMMKFKPRKKDSYKILGYEEERDIYGQPKGRLGALICISNDGGTFKVGSGFTAEQRQNYWNVKENLIGRIVVVKYQHLTPGRNVPRFPVFAEVKHG